MYAATVTGSPVENACRLIKQYESEGRGYYGAALAMLGRDAQGGPVVDSPIVIRTADVDLDGPAHGHRRRDPGARLRPGVRGGRDARQGRRHPQRVRPGAAGADPERRTSPSWSATRTCCSRSTPRNRRLSSFWLTDQAGAPPDPRLPARRVVILDGEDDFVNMLRHVLGVLGLTSTVVRHEDYADGPRLDGFDLVIVGPGPGRPARRRRPEDAHLRAAVAELLAAERPFLAVCLGHQALCHELGHPAGLQGHRLPGHPVTGRASTAAPSGSASTTPSSVGSAPTGAARRGRGRGRPRDR